MKTMLRLTAILLLLTVVGCAASPSTYDPPEVYKRHTQEVSIHLIGKSYQMGVLVEFVMRGSWSHIVQEITLDNGLVLVECFRNDDWLWDLHTWPVRPHSRSMVVYPADVVGADENYGFAHLPDNGFGLKTTVGEEFNAGHQRNYETRGRIVSRGSLSLVWTISDDGVTITVSPFDN